MKVIVFAFSQRNVNKTCLSSALLSSLSLSYRCRTSFVADHCDCSGDYMQVQASQETV